jgi:hypothetical protein
MSKARTIADIGSNDVLETTSTGVDVTGTVTADGLEINKGSVGETASFSGDDVSGARALQIISSTTTNTGDTHSINAQSASGILKLSTNSNTERLRVAKNGDISFYEDTGTTAKFFWDASAESLGIGTTSPNAQDISANNLVVEDTAGNGGITIKTPTAGYGSIHFSDGTGTSAYRGFVNYNHATDSMGFGTYSSNRMSIDASGNLLVGTTSLPTDDNSYIKFGVTSAGEVRAAVNNGNAAMFKRATSDGDIVEFRKDSNIVGSIGAGANAYLTIGKGDTGLLFNNTYEMIQPWDTSNNSGRDGGIDIGHVGGRFKDLYLSGGVYLGGTGSANHLDDYEEGTWTPELTTSGGQTLTKDSSYTTGTYEKVGDLIHVHTYVKLSAIPASMSGRVRIGGLPFSASSGSYSHSSAANVHLTGLSSGYSSDGWIGWISFGANSVDVYYAANTNAVSSSNPSHTDALTSTTQIYLSVTYRTA